MDEAELEREEREIEGIVYFLTTNDPTGGLVEGAQTKNFDIQGWGNQRLKQLIQQEKEAVLREFARYCHDKVLTKMDDRDFYWSFDKYVTDFLQSLSSQPEWKKD